MRLFMRGTSPILVTAALSVAVLVSAMGVYLGRSATPERVVNTHALEPVEPRSYLAIRDDDANGIPDWQDELSKNGITIATSSETVIKDPIANMGDSVAQALYGGYLSLKQYGTYSPQQGEQLAHTIAAQIRAPELEAPLTVDDVKIRDASAGGALEYRSELRTALAPLLTDEPPEIEYYAQYVTTKDASWLPKLEEAAKRYRSAQENMLAVAVPKEAIPEHLRALNALGAYAETLERMARYADDTFAAVALLKTMNETEEEMLHAFDSLAQYYVRTAQN